MYRIAVVGCGMMAGPWIENVKDREDSVILALVDVDLEAARKCKEAHHLDAAIYRDLKKALEEEEVNLVFDITPPEHHYETVTTALAQGCHVFGEKPMSDSLDKARQMVACAEATGKEYFVMQNRRYLTHIHSMKQFLDRGTLGEIGQLSANFQLNPHFGGFREEMASPLIADMAIHTFDAARYLTGKDPVSVYCHEFNPVWSWYKGNANAVCVFEMADGSVFDYRGSWCANGLTTSWESEWRASCAGGSVLWDGHNRLIYQAEEGDNGKDGISHESVHQTLNQVEVTELDKEGHAGCIADMFDALSKGIRPQTDCRDNIQSVSMVHKAIESARTGRVIRF